MTGHRTTLLALAGAVLFTVGTAAQAPAPAPRLTPALRGEAQVAMTAPAVKRTATRVAVPGCSTRTSALPSASSSMA